MNPAEGPALQILVGVSIPVLTAVIILAIKRLVSRRPANGDRRAESEALKAQIQHALIGNEEFARMKQRLHDLENNASTTRSEVRVLLGSVRELQLRLEQLEQDA